MHIYYCHSVQNTTARRTARLPRTSHILVVVFELAPHHCSIESIGRKFATRPSMSSSSLLSSISMLTMRLLQGPSRPHRFWSVHQSLVTSIILLLQQVSLILYASLILSASLCFSFPPHVNVRLRLPVSPSLSAPHIQTTEVFFFEYLRGLICHIYRPLRPLDRQ